MPEINLTSRKKSPPPKILGSHIYDTDVQEYVVKYSEAYREAGHDFTKSFKVLRLAYLFKYHILTADDIFLYETLQLLYERGIPFSNEGLARELGMGKTTFRQCLDNLQNAELLDIYKTDGQGQPNYYLLRTPYFERESLDGKSPAQIRRQNEICKEGQEVPETFIESHALRLNRQVKKNHVKKLRQINPEKLEKRHKSLYQKIKSEFESKKLVWFSIVKKLGSQKAAALDNLIWRLAKSDFSNVETTAFNQILRDRIKSYFSQLEITFDVWLVDTGEQLFHFYSPNIQRKEKRQTKPAPKPAMSADTANYGDASGQTVNDDDIRRQEETDYLRTLLKAKVDKSNSYTSFEIKDLVRVIRDYAPHLSLTETQIVVTEIFDGLVWQKIKIEMEKRE